MDDFSTMVAPLKLGGEDDKRLGQYWSVLISSKDNSERQLICLLALHQTDAFDRVMDAIAEGDESIIEIRTAGMSEARKAWTNGDVARC
tara:strand:- start:1372 stop:1638 length:267 start_codon:yes stop_codon:yes gene_type:complete